MRWVIAALALVSCLAHGDPAAWRVTSAAGGELWLLGSVHYLRESDYPLPPNIDRLYEQSDGLVMEIDFDDLDAFAAPALFAQAGTLTPDRTLQDELAPSLYESAEAMAVELGLDWSIAAHYEPWMLAVVLMDLGMNSMGFDSDLGLEQHLLRLASRDGREILGLETLEDQIGIFDGLSSNEQADLLAQTLAELDSAEQMMDELLGAWREGRLDALADQLIADFETIPELYRALVTDRNQRWLVRLESLLSDDESYLVVVGALHLVGEGSVVELLRDQGFTVTPEE